MEFLQKIPSSTELRGAEPEAVVPDLACLRTGIVNLYLFGHRGASEEPWVLIDAGMPGSAARIIRAAEGWIGSGRAPTARATSAT